MLKVFATDFRQYCEHVQRESIAVTSHSRTNGYFVSEDEYKEHMKLKQQKRNAYLCPKPSSLWSYSYSVVFMIMLDKQ
jgi:hypothetical protein